MEEQSKKSNNQDTNIGSGSSSSNSSTYLETSKAKTPVWLLKCPSSVSRSLQPPSHAAPSRPVAKVVVSIDPLLPDDDTDSSSPEFTMEMIGTEYGNSADRNRPKRYNLNMSKDFIPTAVFSDSSQGNFAVEGEIMNKFDMRPHQENIEEYGKLYRERSDKSMARNRQTQVIDDDYGLNMRPKLQIGPTDKKNIGRQRSAMRRTRRDRTEMESIIFNLFEKQPIWSLRQLIRETNQPEQFLRDLVKDLCVYNFNGPSKGCYELKPEYKKATAESSTNEFSL